MNINIINWLGAIFEEKLQSSKEDGVQVAQMVLSNDEQTQSEIILSYYENEAEGKSVINKLRQLKQKFKLLDPQNNESRSTNQWVNKNVNNNNRNDNTPKTPNNSNNNNISRASPQEFKNTPRPNKKNRKNKNQSYNQNNDTQSGYDNSSNNYNNNTPNSNPNSNNSTPNFTSNSNNNNNNNTNNNNNIPNNNNNISNNNNNPWTNRAKKNVWEDSKFKSQTQKEQEQKDIEAAIQLSIKEYETREFKNKFFLDESPKSDPSPKASPRSDNLPEYTDNIPKSRCIKECFGSIHECFINCVQCGFILCKLDSQLSFCPKCGAKLLLKMSKEGNDKSKNDAIEYKNKLLEYDKTQIARSKIYDDQKDYFRLGYDRWAPENKENPKPKKMKKTYSINLITKEVVEELVPVSDDEDYGVDVSPSVEIKSDRLEVLTEKFTSTPIKSQKGGVSGGALHKINKFVRTQHDYDGF